MDFPAPITFQLAYVTRDLTRARASLSQAMGLTGWAVVPATGVDLQIPAGATMSMKVEVAWTGAWQIELIEPMAGATGIYEQGLPPGDGVAFHHVGALIPGTRDDWDRFRATIADAAIAIEGGRSQMRFIYVDERDTLGHFIEYVWMSDAFVAANPAWTPVQRLRG